VCPSGEEQKQAGDVWHVAIVFGHAESGEGHDRANLILAGNIDAIIPAVAKAQKSTVVSLAVPGSIRTDWRDSVPAILACILPGEQAGPALADVLFGDTPPQAKLPVTFPIGENDQNMSVEQCAGAHFWIEWLGDLWARGGGRFGRYPGVPAGGFARQSNYTEGFIVGYRWYDKHGVAPAFPFGHGLTYGDFKYTDLVVSGRTISFTVTRTAGAGCDTAQVYSRHS
jgi:beta-glucosidase